MKKRFLSLSGRYVVILLAGHGSQEPENPPDPVNPEPDGLALGRSPRQIEF